MKGKTHMKLTVHLEGKNRAELVDGLKAHLALLGGEVGGPVDAPAPAPKKAKKVKEEEPEEEDSSFELGDEEEETEAEETEEESEEEESEATEADVAKACKAYVAKHGKEKGNAKIVKIFAKYGAKNLAKLKPENYSDVLAALGA